MGYVAQDTGLRGVCGLDDRFSGMPQDVFRFFHDAFDASPTAVASAPGRIEFIGNHTDYNGGCVIGGAIDRRTYVGVGPRRDRLLRLVSDQYDGVVELDLDAPDGPTAGDWARYPLAVLHSLGEQFEIPTGFEAAIVSDLPTGAGLSSSAALEMAATLAFSTVLGLELSVEDLIGISHTAETRYVGVPCGLLDQSVVGLGRADRLVFLDASDASHRLIPIPSNTHVWIVRTHESHVLSDSFYARRRSECSEALERLSGFVPGISRLTVLHPFDIVAYGDGLSETLRKRARHVVEEQDRVLRAVEETDPREIGSLLKASHASSRDLFENSTEALDFLVACLSDTKGVLGTRLTGGGFGGAAIAWTNDAFNPADLDDLRAAYTDRFSTPCETFMVDWADGVRLEAPPGAAS